MTFIQTEIHVKFNLHLHALRAIFFTNKNKLIYLYREIATYVHKHMHTHSYVFISVLKYSWQQIYKYITLPQSFVLTYFKN